jgi:hypothetical protein
MPTFAPSFAPSFAPTVAEEENPRWILGVVLGL